MTEVYKIIHDMYDRSVALELPRNIVLRKSSVSAQHGLISGSLGSLVYYAITSYHNKTKTLKDSNGLLNSNHYDIKRSRSQQQERERKQFRP